MARLTSRRPTAIAAQNVPVRPPASQRSFADGLPKRAEHCGRRQWRGILSAARFKYGGCGGEPSFPRDSPRPPNAGTIPKCPRCRYGARPPRVTETMRRWWLDRYSLEEIREMAAEMWPDSGGSTR